jgi:uncharacterized protein YxjI
MDQSQLQAVTELAVRQRLTLMVNRYEIRTVRPDGSEGDLVALAQQKRLAFKEQVTFYADEDRRTPVFGFKARQRIDLGATYDVTGAGGEVIGQFRKDFARSLLRSTWHLQQGDLPEVTGQERNVAVALLRRGWEVIPFVSAVPFAVPYHFDFVAPDGSPVMTVERKMSVRDSYRVRIATPALDRRLAAAMAVALDALQSR